MANRRTAKDVNHGERRERRSRTVEGKANYILADAEMMRYCITAVAAAGGALRLGYTRDGGAYAIGVYGDGEPYTDYVRPNESIDEYFRELSESFGGIVGDGSFTG